MIEIFFNMNIFFSGDNEENLKNYYEIIADHREIIRSMLNLQGSISILKDDVSLLIKVNYYNFFI